MAIDASSSMAAGALGPALGASADSSTGRNPYVRPSNEAPAPSAAADAPIHDVLEHEILSPSTIAALVEQQVAESGRPSTDPALAPSAAFMSMALSHAYPKAVALSQAAARVPAEERSFAPAESSAPPDKIHSDMLEASADKDADAPTPEPSGDAPEKALAEGSVFDSRA
jgi:hypothetical protein